MAYIPFESLVDKNNQISMYKLVLTAATRANELAQGAKVLIDTKSKKVSTIAMEEISAGKVYYDNAKSSKSKKAAS